jgi:pimeloyl-ACP methyl ester carboxylesterase
MYGTRDFVRESGKVFLKGIEGSKQALIENAGHIAQMDQPEAFVREVDQFLGSSSKSSGKS